MGRTVVSKKDLEENRRKREEEYFRATMDESAGSDLRVASHYSRAFPPPSKLGASEQEADDYMSRLIKYIPAEVIMLYLTLDAIFRSSQTIPAAVYWIIFGFGALATYLYLWRVMKVKKQVQLVISVGAYCVWVFATGGPFEQLIWYEPVYGGLLLPTYTFLIALAEA